MSVLTLALAKEYLQIGHTAQDSVVQVLLDGAEDFIAKQLNIVLTSGPVTEKLDGGQRWLYPSKRPVTAVASVVDRWNSNEAYTFLLEGNGMISRADANGRPLGDWPEGASRFTVTYTAGHVALPAGLKIPILMLVQRAYQARSGEASASVAGVSMNWAKLMDSDIAKLCEPFNCRRVVRC